MLSLIFNDPQRCPLYAVLSIRDRFKTFCDAFRFDCRHFDELPKRCFEFLDATIDYLKKLQERERRSYLLVVAAVLEKALFSSINQYKSDFSKATPRAPNFVMSAILDLGDM